ncbi:hypothetical protein ACSNOI_32480 [Actinomadura kijaniata]|uniref:hypothetical protein n=1 Tax=Actinomadura kijaniata TaxID=46161 RepID=UPI003F1D7DB1
MRPARHRVPRYVDVAELCARYETYAVMALAALAGAIAATIWAKRRRRTTR